MGTVTSNQPIFTLPAQLIVWAIQAAKAACLKASNHRAAAPAATTAQSDLISRPLVPTAAKHFAVLTLLWLATVMVAAQLGVV